MLCNSRGNEREKDEKNGKHFYSFFNFSICSIIVVFTHSHTHMPVKMPCTVYHFQMSRLYRKGKCAKTWFMFQFQAIHVSDSVHRTAKYIWSEVIKYNPLQKSKMCAWCGFRLNRYRNTMDWKENWRKIEMCSVGTMSHPKSIFI